MNKILRSANISRLLLTFVALFLLMPNAQAENYNELSRLSNETLYAMAKSQLSHSRQNDSALTCLNIIVSRNDMNPDSAQSWLNANALIQLGYIYMSSFFDYSRSYEYLYRAYNICKNRHYDRILTAVLVNLGVLQFLDAHTLYQQTYDDEAMKYFRDAFWLAKKNRQSDMMIISFTNMASIAIMSDHLEAIIKEANVANHTNMNAGYGLNDYMTLVVKGILHLNEKKYTEAKSDFLNMKDKVKVNHVIDSCRCNLLSLVFAAKAASLENNHSEAIGLTQEALNIAKQNKMSDAIIDCYYYLTNFYRQAGQLDKARLMDYQYLNSQRDFIKDSGIQRQVHMKAEKYLNQKNEELKSSIRKQKATERALMLAMAFALVVIIFSFFLYRLYKKQKEYALSLYNKNVELLHLKNDRRTSSQLDEKDKDALMKRIQEVMDNTEEIIKPDFNLPQLAEKVNSNSHYVSQVINEKTGDTFKTMLNTRRIKEACRRLSDQDTYGNLTIEAIASTVGFRSRSNFLVVFKKITGLSPSEFQRLAKEHCSEKS